MPRVKAVIWDYFSINDDCDKFVSCAVCKERVSRGGSCVKSFNMTNLINHLKKKHPSGYVDYEEKKKIQLKEKEKQKEQAAFRQLTMIEAETKVKIWDINDPHAVRIHKLVGEMIATDNQPFSVIHDTGFNCLILNHLNPGMCYQAKNISRKILYKTSKKKSMES